MNDAIPVQPCGRLHDRRQPARFPLQKFISAVFNLPSMPSKQRLVLLTLSFLATDNGNVDHLVIPGDSNG